MCWKRKERKSFVVHKRLVEDGDDHNAGGVPKGYVPVLVGNEGSTKRYVLPLKMFKNPCMGMLLDMSAQEFGYREQGVLRIPCDIDHFQGILDMNCK